MLEDGLEDGTATGIDNGERKKEAGEHANDNFVADSFVVIPNLEQGAGAGGGDCAGGELD